MEDNSYVSLSLEKYNELYDKAKKFDEISEKYSDKIDKALDEAIESLHKIACGESKKVTVPVTDNEESTYKFKVGDRVIGNSLANDCYYTTIQGWEGTAEEVNEDGFKADGYDLEYKYFDKKEEEK